MAARAHQIREFKILEEELQTLGKGATVYKQQQNSGVFFRTTKEKAFVECKKTLDSLVQEYKDVEHLPGKETG